MKSNKFFEGLKKFLFEFLIVTIGILAAFNINKWDETRKLKKEETNAYETIKKELKSDKYIFNYYKEKSKRAIDYLIPLLEGNYSKSDSVIFYLKTFYDLQEGNATYVNLKYSGKLNVLENLEIKKRLFLYYETYYQGLERISNTHNNLIDNIINPYLIQNTKYNASKDEIEKYLENEVFKNIINYQIKQLMQNVSVIKKSENLINKTLEYIDEELMEK